MASKNGLRNVVGSQTMNLLWTAFFPHTTRGGESQELVRNSPQKYMVTKGLLRNKTYSFDYRLCTLKILFWIKISLPILWWIPFLLRPLKRWRDEFREDARARLFISPLWEGGIKNGPKLGVGESTKVWVWSNWKFKRLRYICIYRIYVIMQVIG